MTVILARDLDGQRADRVEVRHLPQTSTAVLQVRIATTHLSAEEWARLAIVAAAWAKVDATVRECDTCREHTPHEDELCLICGDVCCMSGDSPCAWHAEQARVRAEDRLEAMAEEAALREIR